MEKSDQIRFRNAFSWLGLREDPSRGEFSAAVEVALSERIAELNRAELHALRVIWRDLGLYGQLARAADRGAVVDLGDLSASGGEPVADFASAVGLSVAPCDQGSQQQRQPSRGGRVDHRARDERAPAASSYAVVNWRADAGDGRA